jgi:hypothetical protein
MTNEMDETKIRASCKMICFSLLEDLQQCVESLSRLPNNTSLSTEPNRSHVKLGRGGMKFRLVMEVAGRLMSYDEK